MLRAALPARGGVPLETVTEALLAALRFRAFPDAARRCARCGRAGMRLVVVSNWDVSLHAALEPGRASRRCCTARSPRRSSALSKPDPAIFRHGAACSPGVPAENALHVGDTPELDVAGARAAGIEPLLAAPCAREAPPAGVRVIRSLRELAACAP